MRRVILKLQIHTMLLQQFTFGDTA